MIEGDRPGGGSGGDGAPCSTARPSNLEQAESWTAYTTARATSGFRDLPWTRILDCEIRFLARDGEMIAMPDLVSRDVVYENVWLAESDGRHFKAYLGTAYREFPVSAKLGGEDGHGRESG